jgi:hypothetical protein
MVHLQPYATTAKLRFPTVAIENSFAKLSILITNQSQPMRS